jgi:hypothetical protein
MSVMKGIIEELAAVKELQNMDKEMIWRVYYDSLNLINPILIDSL